MNGTFKIKPLFCFLVISSAMVLSAAFAPVETSFAATTVTTAQENNYLPTTQKLVRLVESNPSLKKLLEKSISESSKINPDPQTNPAQSLSAYFDYINWASRAMPWAILPNVKENHPKLYNQIDQSLNYFYFVNDRPLKELEGKGLYIPSVQYVEPYRSWLIDFIKEYGKFLSTPQSWNEEYLKQARSDSRFGLDSGEYEDPSNWKSFNDFFVRRLSSKDKRPIAAENDDSVVVFPGDSVTQGVWTINDQNALARRDGKPVGQPDFVAIKSKKFSSVEELMADSPYKKAFAGGTMTHTFLDVYDYHRFHFPVSGIIKDVRKIDGDVALGGHITWEPSTKTYVLNASIPGWQMIETRALVVVETKDFGLVGILPVGMSQVSSVWLEDNIKVGTSVRKGDPLGCFLFGGSDIVMLFQKGVHFELTVPKEGNRYSHRLMGQEYGKLSK